MLPAWRRHAHVPRRPVAGADPSLGVALDAPPQDRRTPQDRSDRAGPPLGAVQRSCLALRAEVRRVPGHALRHPTSCAFYSKRGNVLKQFAELAEEVRDQLRVREAILDGEVIAFDEEGRADFRLLMRRQGDSTTPPSTSSGSTAGTSDPSRWSSGSAG